MLLFILFYFFKAVVGRKQDGQEAGAVALLHCAILINEVIYHQTLHDAKVVVYDLGEGSQAVGCAGSVATETKQKIEIKKIK